MQKILICQIITNYQSIGILSNNHKLSKHRNIVLHKTKSLESVCWYLSLTLTAVAHKLTKLQTGITTCPFLTVSSVFSTLESIVYLSFANCPFFTIKTLPLATIPFFSKPTVSNYQYTGLAHSCAHAHCKLTNHYLSFSHRFLLSSLVLSQEDRKFWINTLSKLGQGS